MGMLIRHAMIAATLAIVPLGCTSSQPPRQPTADELAAARSVAARESAIQRFQQQPRMDSRNDKRVGDQPLEDPHNAGRPIED